MKLGIMQPYFFPYAGYFELIARTDRWIVFDVVQYNARSWMNRNRILHPVQGTQYVSVPVQRQPHGTTIRDIHLVDAAAARDRMLGQLTHYRARAPYFGAVVDLVRQTFDTAPADGLVDVCVRGLGAVCEYLGIAFQWDLASDLSLDRSTVAHHGQWALRIAEALGATDYLNPPGGRDLFVPQEWRQAGIGLHFTQLQPLVYDPTPYEFVPHLSILDVLMWVPAKDVSAFLRTKPIDTARHPEGRAVSA